MPRPPAVRLRLLAGALILALLGACAAPAPAPGLADVLDRPAERALMAGQRAYDDGAYAQAEAELKKSRAAGLASKRDQATAHKLLAFVYCTSNRTADCEAAFRAARAADPGFALARSEAGHPLWAPVYKRVITP